MDSDFIKLSVREALKGIKKGDGGPFGAVVVRKGKVVSSAHNEVLKTKDPTMHAEINAIRKASKKLKNFDLSDCVIYSSSEPCSMCLSAIHWARIKKVYYGLNFNDAKVMGFDDKKINDSVSGEKGLVEKKNICRDDCAPIIGEWKNSKNRKLY